MRQSVVRHFGALRIAAQSLATCYQTNCSSSFPNVYSDPRYSHHSQYTSIGSNSTHSFKYKSQGDASKLLFIAETEGGVKMCVKFVLRYSVEPHQKCAELGFTPQLKGYKDLPGGWKMVIMEAIDNDFV